MTEYILLTVIGLSFSFIAIALFCAVVEDRLIRSFPNKYNII